LYDAYGGQVLAKIAEALERALARRAIEGTPGCAVPKILARGEGWTVADVVCTSGPDDRQFEERHSHYAIGLVIAGAFQYRSTLGGGLMTPGSVMLGNAGECYECSHEHGRGDRCVAFWYAPDYFERLAADAGASHRSLAFHTARLPPLRMCAPLIARAAAGASAATDVPWDELGVALATRVVGATATKGAEDWLPLNAAARVTQVVQTIARCPEARLPLARLAREAGLSPYHFLRTFERLTGVTPHQYILRTRLREAALRLEQEPDSVLGIALDCGFGDVSNFNRAFRREFGVSPRAYRQSGRACP